MTQHTATHEPQTEILLKEYGFCIGDANHLEQYIWTAAGLLITASVAGLSVISGSLPATANLYDYSIRILVSILSLAFVWIWRMTAQRWHAIQEVMYYRAREIENDIGIYKNRYVTNLYRAISNKEYDRDPKIESLVTAFKNRHKSHSVRRTVKWISNILSIVWILALVIQVATVLGWV